MNNQKPKGYYNSEWELYTTPHLSFSSFMGIKDNHYELQDAELSKLFMAAKEEVSRALSRVMRGEAVKAFFDNLQKKVEEEALEISQREE